MDKYEAVAARLMNHVDCPHWMDDNHYCVRCDNLRPVICALAEAHKAGARDAYLDAAKGTDMFLVDGYDMMRFRKAVVSWLEKKAAALEPKVAQ